MHHCRCKFGIELTDTTGTIAAIIFGVQAENLFSITAKDRMHNTNLDGQVSLDALGNLCNTDDYFIQLRAYPFKISSTMQYKFTVNAIHKECAINTPKFHERAPDLVSSSSTKRARKELFALASASTGNTLKPSNIIDEATPLTTDGPIAPLDAKNA
ncbi:hypothetical protein CsSME_00010613 [Camellia sinensis var. sinensis]